MYRKDWIPTPVLLYKGVMFVRGITAQKLYKYRLPSAGMWRVLLSRISPDYPMKTPCEIFTDNEARALRYMAKIGNVNAARHQTLKWKCLERLYVGTVTTERHLSLFPV